MGELNADKFERLWNEPRVQRAENLDRSAQEKEIVEIAEASHKSLPFKGSAVSGTVNRTFIL